MPGTQENNKKKLFAEKELGSVGKPETQVLFCMA
jgi:hypothetical protein